MNENFENAIHEIVPLNQHIPIRIFYGHDKERSYIVPHFHEDIEIIALKTGTLKLTDKTQNYFLKAGDIHIFNSNTIHSILSEDMSMEAVVLQISYKFVREFSPEIDLYQFSAQLFHEDHGSVHILREELFKLIACTESQSEFSNLKAYSILFHILELLLENFSYRITTKQARANSKYYQRIYKLTDYMKKHFSEQIFLTDLADMVHLNPSYLSRFFKQHFGITFYEYLTNIRLEYAYTQITQTDLPVMTIMDESGFQTYHQFNKEFKKRYNATPRQLRSKSKST